MRLFQLCCARPWNGFAFGERAIASGWRSPAQRHREAGYNTLESRALIAYRLRVVRV
jgi:hypothetical protein